MTDDMPARPGHVHCPTCDRASAWTANPTRPFCSLTCKLRDLGKWLDERYRVPGPAVSLLEAGAPDGPGADA